jgi:Acetyltransferases, including N-acetylases of ribosomal proteins
MAELHTSRLLLRRWHSGDLREVTGIFADPGFSWHPFRRARTPEEARAFLDRALSHWDRHGFGRWAVCERTTGRLLGLRGRQRVVVAPGGRRLGIGWRLASSAWGRGLGHEAAAATADEAFSRGTDLLVAVVEVGNDASRRICARLGMRETDIARHPEFGTPHVIATLHRSQEAEEANSTSHTRSE